ncbi:MAG TPA: hypothetical protein VJ279_08395 [Hanamia sp.]|jgi:hypothetical protein|nr:hypothetical protein [Hanamia sp.]
MDFLKDKKYWQGQLETLQKTRQYVLNSLRLIEHDMACCEKRISDDEEALNKMLPDFNRVQIRKDVEL